MNRKTVLKRSLSFLLCLVMVVSCLPALSMTAAAGDRILNVISGSKKADPSTLNGWEAYFGAGKMDTEFAGAVWTDKSVFDKVTADLPGVTLTDNNNFLVALSAIASNLSITGHASAPTDTMLVLDMSGSMVDDTYEVGTIRTGNGSNYRYNTAYGIDMSLINAMIEATNDTIDQLMAQNDNNRVGVILYSGNTSTNQAATPSTATVVMPLGRYSGVDGEYLSVDATYRTDALYAYSNRRWQATGQTATYVSSGSAVNVSVKDGLKTEAGATVSDVSKRANGGTYIQNGLYQAMNQFLSVTDTTVPEGRSQAGTERIPAIVLMSDGAPTIATTSYNNIGNSNTGDGSNTNDRITFLTQLTAAYVRGRVAAHYQENDRDDKDVLFLTLGLGTENSTAATNTLYPAGSNSDLVEYWDNYLDASAGSNATIISGQGGLQVYREAAVEAMNYVDKYYYANDAQSLIDSFEEIFGEISLKAQSYTTLVEGGNADFSGYVSFEDELGELMHVFNVSGILLGDTLFTGMELAKGLNVDNMGTVDVPSASGDELVATVKERIPGTTTSQAQQLIANAYKDQQLYYANDDNWSNYIGWYADAEGKYVGFWDKESGYTDAPAGAVYANRSYGYLGENGNSDMMHVVVMVRTNLATLHQTVIFKIPAALLPTVQYKVTLDAENPSSVEEFTREEAVPMRLAFEVGLRSDINSINLEQKIAEHVAKGGHVHRNNDGTVTFYTNEWAIGNDKNGNGIPDPDEVDNAEVAESHFHPAFDNSRFYYTDDTVILTGNNATVTGSIRPTDTDSDPSNGTGYYYDRYIYGTNGRTAIKTPIAATTLENDAKYDTANGYWYIPSGTMYHNLARLQTPKTDNKTGTLSYSFFPAVFDSVTKQDIYIFLGNNGSFTVAPAQGITLTKTVATASDSPDAPTEFTFTVTLSQEVANPTITDTDGNPLDNVATVSGNAITVRLNAGETVVITGIPTGTTYTVEEETSRYYTASSTNASGTVAANTIHAVDFVNTAKGSGSLVVSKDVNYPQGFVPGSAHNNTTFTIRVTFTGDVTGMVVPQGATRNDNTFTLVLKDGQSATFANIPEGVSYTVAEDGLSNGYALQELRYSDTNKEIDGNDTDEVHVVNSYTLSPVTPNVKIQGDKTLVTGESNWGGATFTVELLRSDSFADEDAVSTGLTDVMTEEKNRYEIDLSSIQFTTAGTYYFRAVEVIPENRNENIAYDRTFGLFSITVGDADADGNLEIQAVNAYQTTTVSGDSVNGWVLEKDFTNMVTTDRVYVNIQKVVEDSGQNINAHLGDMTFGLFTSMDSDPTPSYYGVTNTLGKTTLMIPVTKDELGAQGKTYYLREIAPAVENRVLGMHYDESWIYAVNITWDDGTNKAIVRYAQIENGQVGPYSVDDDDTLNFEHTNTYESNVTLDIDLTGKKTINGSTNLGNRVFSFSLYESTAAFVKGTVLDTVTNNGNDITFNDVTFTAPGVYYMVAKENASTLGGITVDSTEYHITVEVEKFTDTDGITRLRVVEGYPTVVRYGTSQNVGVNGLNFNNIYTVTGSDTVTIGGKKVLNGRTLVADEFTIGLYGDAACTDLIETATNKADGTFAFTTITYTAADLDENYAEKTYTYYVKELPSGKGGVSDDPNTYTVTVKVGHKDGALTVTPSNNATTLQITNTYVAKPVQVVLNGNKALSGDWSKVTNKDFTFQLFKADAQFKITDNTPVKSETVTGNAAFTMTLNYENGQDGAYYYVLQEFIPAERAGGINYDAGEYHITVKVSDPGDGQLTATSTMYRPGAGNTLNAVFTNVYTVEPTSITLSGNKTYKNGVTGKDLEMEEGIFSFLVLEGNDIENAALVATGHNLADGTIQFTPIQYKTAGVYTYSVVEVSGEVSGVTYDVDKVYTVKVTVVDNGNGTLTATADYNNTPVVFNNTYKAAATEIVIKGNKTLNGRDLVADEFTFELYDKQGVKLETVKNAANGSFTFTAIPVEKEGVYTFTVRETQGEAEGVTYDSTVYTVTVPVIDNLDATFTAKYAYTKDSVTAEALTFVNTYTAPPVTPAPEPTPDIPKTGDSTDLWLWLAVAFVSGGCLFGAAAGKNKKQADEN